MAVEYTPAWKPEDSGQEEEDFSDLRGLKKKLFEDCNDEDTNANESEPEAPNLKQPVLIYLRVRPKRPVEISNHDPDCLHQINDFEMLALPPKTSKTYKNSRTETNHKFSFSHIFSPATTQKELFDETLRPLLKDFFGGQNCLVFTYGVTNSGNGHERRGRGMGRGGDPGRGKRRGRGRDLPIAVICMLVHRCKYTLLKTHFCLHTIAPLCPSSSSSQFVGVYI